MKRPVANLHAVAVKAGCSVPAVSKILNQSKSTVRVSDELRDRVLQIAEELGYTQNFAARSLALKSTSLLGVFIQPQGSGGVGGHYEGHLLRGIERACTECDYDILLISIEHPNEAYAHCVRRLREGRIDGLIIVQTRPADAKLEDLKSTSEHIVVIGHHEKPSTLPWIGYDNAAAVELAIEHLTKLGHRRIAFLGSCLDRPAIDSQMRRDAFVRNMRQRFPSDAEILVHDTSSLSTPLSRSSDFTLLEGRWGVSAFWNRPPEQRPTAFIAYNAAVAAAALQRLQEQNIGVPAQASIIGLDDLPFTRLLFTPLTTVSQPIEALGYAAAKQVFARILGTALPELPSLLPLLNTRSSTGPAPI